MDNILIIGAHPDDIELGCIGTLLKLKKHGKKIIYLVMTKGGNWEQKTYKDRVKEIRSAILCMEIDEVLIGEIKDGNLLHCSETIDFITDIIKKHQIDTIFCQYFKDTHQDHINIAKNCLSVKSICKNLIFYESLTSAEFTPNLFIDITEYEDKKKEILVNYTSQIDKYMRRNQDLMLYIDAKDKLNGIKSCVKYAEGFIINKMSL
ncbi:PIG-L deacetylase family protein [Candidatus Stoquefichus massiliensis]|uniref:PIG-L deacetylase family protein n=1 Tax=Candidatus Stoquefichus massiliensis TaxID=1470350 RepID=UPI000483BE3F|nr:PIG-L family deacetylase [Candidatus Stoquefichus massiliensis]